MNRRERRLLIAAQILVATASSSFAQGGERPLTGSSWTYPSPVDAVLDGPTWIAEGNRELASFGWSLASAGDVNGDGFDDVIVGAPRFSAGEALEGRAFVYLGSADGLSPTPAWTAESDQSYSWFAESVAGAGDVNGDGFDDVIVGAPEFDAGQAQEGRVFLYLGSPIGPSAAPSWTAECNQNDAWFGASVAGAGDVNGDGFDDVLIGAPGFDSGAIDEGRAFLYLGAASGPALFSSWTAESDVAGARFGESVAGAGDSNGDGFDDVIVGAPDFAEEEGRAFVYLGSASGLSPLATWSARANQRGARFGWSVAGAGDVNGDGFDDVLAGAYELDLHRTKEGHAFLYLGGPGGPSLAPDWRAGGHQERARFGWSVAGAGDVNGDRFADLIVGAPRFDGGRTDEGQAFLYLGSAAGPSTTPDWTGRCRQENAELGFGLARAGDVDGDGFGDVIVGAPGFDGGQSREGRAFLYRGKGVGTGFCTSTLNSSGNVAIISAEGSDVAADRDTTLRTVGCPPEVAGLYFFGMSSISFPLGDGFRCVGGSLTRIHPVVTTSSSGVAVRALAFGAPYAHAIVAGADLRFQFWFRDEAAGMSGFNLSNGLRIAFQ